MKKLGVYIHVPFCARKCGYCDFLSFAGCSELFEDYYEALKCELGSWKGLLHNRVINTVFIGGGTPTVLPFEFVCKILSTLNAPRDAEVSIEVNPGTVTAEYLTALRGHGVNRISFGLQSHDDAMLKRLGRIHDFKAFQKSYALASGLGFRINVDLMFALPGQDLCAWERTLDAVIRMSPSSISAYSLTIEENTPFGKMLDNGSLTVCGDELDRKMYHMAIVKLREHGYSHYEISNFALPGCECAHNIKYWTYEEYLGIGLGAHSFIDRVRHANTVDMDLYISTRGNPEKVICDRNEISKAEAISEYIILGLRLIRGVNKHAFRRSFDIDIHDIFAAEISGLIKQGLIIDDQDFIRLTDKGLDLANIAMAEFIK